MSAPVSASNKPYARIPNGVVVNTAAFSGTIVAEFSDFVPLTLLKVGDFLSDCAM